MVRRSVVKKVCCRVSLMKGKWVSVQILLPYLFRILGNPVKGRIRKGQTMYDRRMTYDRRSRFTKHPRILGINKYDEQAIQTLKQIANMYYTKMLAK